MTVVALGSMRGAPGATTAAVALAARWPRPDPAGSGGWQPEDRWRLVVEADPAGGVMAVRYGIGSSPGLVELARHARDGLAVGQLWDYAQAVLGGLPVVVAPGGAAEATQLVEAAGEATVRQLAELEEVVVLVDCGRLTPWSPARPVAAAADLVVVAARPNGEHLRAVAHEIDGLASVTGPAGVVLVGDRPYSPEEVGRTLDVPVYGRLADDPRGAAAVGGQGTRRQLESSDLGRTARTVAERLAQVAASRDRGGVNGRRTTRSSRRGRR